MDRVKSDVEAGFRILGSSNRDSHLWHGFRRDEDLWVDDGDCNVYFYGEGRSRRGPSLKIPTQLLLEAQCAPLLGCIREDLSPEPPSTNAARRGSYCSTSASSDSAEHAMCHLFLAAPTHADRDEAFRWHVTTRNFFAWLLGKPLVGEHLGHTLVQLLERMRAFREASADNMRDLLAYIDEMGYMDMANNPDVAVAMLQFAEACKSGDLWTEAFAHCVGMNDLVRSSREFKSVSRVSRALISRAHLEMDIHTSRSWKSISTLLEEESQHFSLSPRARAHLDNFRAFLQSYYINQIGYWPPQEDDARLIHIYRAMTIDFECLYDFLADKSVIGGSSQQRPLRGVVSASQVVDNFNSRQGFSALPFSLPLEPKFESNDAHTRSEHSSSTFGFGGKRNREHLMRTARTALARSTNSHVTVLSSSSILQAYETFEMQHPSTGDDFASVVEARRIRWLLVYGILQTLLDVTNAPSVIRQQDTDYPLCCLTEGTPPWQGMEKWQHTLPPHPLLRESHEQNAEEWNARQSIETRPFDDSQKPVANALGILNVSADSELVVVKPKRLSFWSSRSFGLRKRVTPLRTGKTISRGSLNASTEGKRPSTNLDSPTMVAAFENGNTAPRSPESDDAGRSERSLQAFSDTELSPNAEVEEYLANGSPAASDISSRSRISRTFSESSHYSSDSRSVDIESPLTPNYSNEELYGTKSPEKRNRFVEFDDFAQLYTLSEDLWAPKEEGAWVPSQTGSFLAMAGSLS